MSVVFVGWNVDAHQIVVFSCLVLSLTCRLVHCSLLLEINIDQSSQNMFLPVVFVLVECKKGAVAVGRGVAGDKWFFVGSVPAHTVPQEAGNTQEGGNKVC